MSERPLHEELRDRYRPLRPLEVVELGNSGVRGVQVPPRQLGARHLGDEMIHGGLGCEPIVIEGEGEQRARECSQLGFDVMRAVRQVEPASEREGGPLADQAPGLGSPEAELRPG